MKERLDLILVNKKFFESRQKAKVAIEKSLVQVNGKIEVKPSVMIDLDSKIEFKPLDYVSRGGEKLTKALKEFQINANEIVAIDIGASTGGFTDVLLQNGAKKVFCIDTGTNQLSTKILNNPKVTNFEKTNYLTFKNDFFSQVQLVVMDVSFVSSTKFAKKLKTDFPNANIIILIKPQFECGVEIAKKHKGVIKEKQIHMQVLKQVAEEFQRVGLCLRKLTFSPIVGKDGNIEFLALFSHENGEIFTDFQKVIDLAHQKE